MGKKTKKKQQKKKNLVEAAPVGVSPPLVAGGGFSKNFILLHCCRP